MSYHVHIYTIVWHNIQYIRCDESSTESDEETPRQRGIVQVCLPSPLLPSIRSKVTILIIIWYCSSLFSSLLFFIPFSLPSSLPISLPIFISHVTLILISPSSFSHHSILISTTPFPSPSLPWFLPSSLPPSFLFSSPLFSFLLHSLGWLLD